MKIGLKTFFILFVISATPCVTVAEEKPQDTLADIRALRADKKSNEAIVKAKNSVKDVDPAKVDLVNAAAWVELFTMAQDYKGTRVVAARWAENASGEDKFKAQVAVLNSDYRLKDYSSAASLLSEIRPPNNEEAARIATMANGYVYNALRDSNKETALKILAAGERMVPKEGFTNDRERDFAKRAADSLAGTRKAIEENPGKEVEAVQKQRAAQFAGLIGGRLGGNNTNAAATRADAAATRDEKLGKFLGVAAPDFTATRAHGEFKSLHDLKGKVVVLDFFAHWCGPCIKSLPSMREIYDGLKPKGLEMVGVTQFYGYYKTENKTAKDMPAETEFARMKDFMEEKKINWPVAFVDSAVFEKYGCSGIPHVVVIDKAGKICKVKVGYYPDQVEAFREELKKLLEL